MSTNKLDKSLLKLTKPLNKLTKIQMTYSMMKRNWQGSIKENLAVASRSNCI